MITIILIFLLLSVPVYSSAAPKAFPKPVAESLGQLEVFHNGRVTSVRCLADEYVRKVYGSQKVKGYNSVQVLSGWMFYYDSWQEVPVHKDKYHYLMDNIASGSSLAIFPYANDSGILEWYSPSETLPSDIPSEEWMFMRRVLTVIGEMVFRGQETEAVEYLQKVHKYQLEKLAVNAPEAKTRKLEELYSDVGMTRLPAIIALTLGIILFLTARRMNTKRFRYVAYVLAVYPAVLLILRSIILRKFPMNTAAEFMLAIALAALLFSSVRGRRAGNAVSQGMIVGGFAMLVASMDISSPEIGAVSSVLESPYLPFHVGSIMLSYTLFALICLNSIAALVHKSDPEITASSRRMMYPAIILLAVGTVIGSIWAKEAWGNYWSWDPKETWALITLLIYSFSICKNGFSLLKKDTAYNIFCIFAFIAVLFTYFGVNYILGGMHSYA